MSNKFNVLYFGTWGYGKAGLEGLIECDNVNLVKIFTKWDLESGNSYYNQVFELGVRTNAEIINTQQEKKDKDEFEKQILNSGKIDFIISCSFDRFFSPSILKYPRRAAVNIHPSLLPKYRGVKPLENALVHGENEIGITLHLLSAEVDAGDILIQKGNSINHDQTFGELYALQCFQITDCIKTFFKNPEKFVVSGKKQNDKDKTFAPRLPFEIADQDKVRDIILRAKKYKLI